MCEGLDQPASRRNKKKINYNEKKADAEFAKKIKQMERNKSKNAGTRNKTFKSKYQTYLNDKNICWNFIPSLPPSFRKHSRFSNILDLEDSTIDISTNILYQESTALLKKNDHIYMISEPPGEPYYIGRIVSFICKPEWRQAIDSVKNIVNVFPAKYFQVKMNWYYRPRDIQENASNSDPRLVYASLHTDLCPIYSYRGKCTVLHKATFPSEESSYEHLMKPNVFYFDQLFDRYTLSYYDVWDTHKLLNLGTQSSYLAALQKMFPYVYTEEKYPLEKILKKYVLNQKYDNDDEFWDQRCGQCNEWCEKPQCIRCDECGVPVHLYCLEPPLERKPTKGVIWICFECLKKQEFTPDIPQMNNTNGTVFEKKQSEDTFLDREAEKTPLNERKLSDCWFHYLGSKVINSFEDVLIDELNLPFPIKCSRVGPKYQWAGCNDEFSSPKLYSTTGCERGLETSSEPLWFFDSSKISSEKLDQYVQKCQDTFPKTLQIVPQTCNFLDMILKTLVKNSYNAVAAFESCGVELTRESLREPTFTPEEITKFEKAVSEYGSELHPVSKYVGTQPMSMIVRFYYYWKKTERGRSIWGNFKGRKKNRHVSKLQSEDHSANVVKKSRERKPSKIYKMSNLEGDKEWKYMDDSSFDSDKISTVKTCFHCMFCEIDYSPMWYRVTGGCDDENIKTRMMTGVNEKTSTSDKVPFHPKKRNGDLQDEEKLEALCIRCARLWRRYAIRWDSPMNVIRALNGKNISNINSTVEEFLDKAEDNNLVTSAKLAREKFLEWELVQDAELIIKQRYSIFNDPSRLIKMRRNCMSLHTQLNKLVKKLVEKDAFKEYKLRQNLNQFIKVRLEALAKKENKPKRKNKKVQLPSSKLIPDPDLSVNQAKDHKRKWIEIDVDVSEKATLKKRETLSIINDDKERKILGTITSNGDHLIDVISEDKVDLGRISIDAEFRSIRISDKLYLTIFNHLLEKTAAESSKNKNQNSKDKLEPQKKRSKIQNGNSINPSNYQVINESNIPISNKIHNTAGSLALYYSNNPLFYDWAHGKLPKPRIDLLQNALQNSQQLKTNLGRKSKSPTYAIDQLEIQGDSSPREICCVCLEKFSEKDEEELTCANCGLNVHYYCYGCSTQNIQNKHESGTKDYQWLCDACSNDLNPLNSTNYQCSLCIAKEIDHDAAKKKINRAIPDALKISSCGTWCHVICALFNHQLTFGSASTMQPVNNVGAIFLMNNGRECEICSMPGGGLVKCEICPRSFHVTCAQDSAGYRLGFKKIFTDGNKLNERVLSEYGEHFMVRPAIICSQHLESTNELLPLTYQTSSGLPIIEFYCRHYKSVEGYLGSAVKARVQEYDNIAGNHINYERYESKINPGSDVCKTDPMKAIQIPTPSSSLHRKTCSVCSRNCSIYWYGSTCHACHISCSTPTANHATNDKDLIVAKENNMSSSIQCALLDGIQERNLTMSVNDFDLESTGNSSAKGRRKGTKTKHTKGGKDVGFTLMSQNGPSSVQDTPGIPIVIQNLSTNR